VNDHVYKEVDSDYASSPQDAYIQQEVYPAAGLVGDQGIAESDQPSEESLSYYVHVLHGSYSVTSYF
jgi:hypothetical protein